jgi:hypothetical protein
MFSVHDNIMPGMLRVRNQVRDGFSVFLRTHSAGNGR